MAGLAEIVKVNVTTSGVALKQPGFGVALIVGAHTRFPERVRFYTSPDAMLSDGFTTTDAEYLAASRLMGQNPQPSRFAVGRRANLPTMQHTLTPVAQNSRTYAFKLNGRTVSFTSDASATVPEIVADLHAAVQALNPVEPVTAALVGGAGSETALTITANAAGQFVRVETLDPNLLGVEQTHADPGVAADLAAIALENGDWYTLTLTTHSKAEILAAAAWTETAKRLYVQGCQESRIVTTPLAGATDVAAALRTANYARTSLWYHPDNGAFLALALLGTVLPLNPGSVTFKFRQPAGVASVAMTDTHLTNCKDKNCNYLTPFGGVALTGEGKVAAGEYVDVIRDRDWFEARLQVRAVTLLIANPKVPFTDGGIASVEGELRAQVSEAIEAGFLTADPAPTVTVPKASEISTTDKQARRLTGVKCRATIAGAIHELQLDVTLAV